jgi:hypothetical protein
VVNTKVCPECGKLMIKEWGAQLSSDPPQQAWVWWCGCGHREWGGVEIHPSFQLRMVGQWEDVNHPLPMGVHISLIQRRARDLFGWDLHDRLAEYVARLSSAGSGLVDDYLITLDAAGEDGRARMRTMEELVAWHTAYAKTCGMQQGKLYVAKRNLEYAVWQETVTTWGEALGTLKDWLCGAWDWLRDALLPYIELILVAAAVVSLALLIGQLVTFIQALVR